MCDGTRMAPTSTPDLIRRRRREVGFYSQQALASAAGLSIQTVSILERTGFVSRRTAERLAAVLRLSPEDILAGSRP